MRKIYVTASEMLQLREQGLSNHDIAKALDISYATVRKYIGKQGGRMEGLAAFKDAPVKKAVPEEPTVPEIPVYEPVPIKELYSLGDKEVCISHAERVVKIWGKQSGGPCNYGREEVSFSFDAIPDLVQFLAWAMRTRMTPKGEEASGKDQQQGEGRTL